MGAKSGALEWHAARRAAHAAASALPVETVTLAQALGRRLAADLVATADVPHYASSAMDGWAVAGDAPWLLIDAESAGVPGRLDSGCAVPIVTGGVVPEGAHGVLRSEHGEVVESATLVRNSHATEGEPRPGQHVRAAGEEARSGDAVVRAGRVVNPAHLAVAAACGLAELTVAGRPRVRLVLTGDEVIDAGVPGAGQVRDSFRHMLPAIVGAFGGEVVWIERLGDDRDALTGALDSRALAAGAHDRPHVVITTGGTGHSRVDQLRPALESLCADYVVDGVAMRPGAPSLLARLPDGTLVVGLPGNPLAAVMGALTLAAPLLAALTGAPLRSTGQLPAAEAIPVRGSVTQLLPYRREGGCAVPTTWRGSGMMRGLADAHGVLVCGPDAVAAGDAVETLPLPWVVTSDLD